MKKKYIIELEEPEMFDDREFYKCTQMPWWALSENIVENLTPYTEPDLEQVRKEAFKNGYDTACKDIDIKSKTNAAYRKGLEDSWEAAKKISALSIVTIHEIFGWVSGKTDVFPIFTAAEAIEKLKQYEQEKDRQARIEYNFDEIKDVLNTTMKECNVSLDEIAAVLQKMMEADNG